MLLELNVLWMRLTASIDPSSSCLLPVVARRLLRVLTKGVRHQPTALQALDVSHTTKPVIVSDDPQAAFLTVWRFWQNWASAKDERFAFLVT